MLTSSDIVQLTWPISRSERKTEQKINVVHSLMKQTIMSRFPHNFSTCFQHFLRMSFTVWGSFHHIILFFSCSSNPLQQFNGFWVASCRNWSGWKRLLIFLSVDFLTFATRGFWINSDGNVVDNGVKWASGIVGPPIQSLDGVGAEGFWSYLII